MEYLIGVLLGVVVCVFALVTGFDRDRAFYPTVLAVIPTYYILFAAMASSTQAVVIESTVTCAFWALAVVGFTKNLWLVAAGLAGHGVFDFFLHQSFRIRVFRRSGPVSAGQSMFFSARSWPFSL